MIFLVGSQEVTFFSFPMYEIGTSKDFSLSIVTDEDEAYDGTYLALSDPDLVGKVFAKIPFSETYVQIPIVGDNSWYIGQLPSDSIYEIDVRLNLEASDINEFGNSYFSIHVVEGLPNSSLSDSTLFFGEIGPELFEGDGVYGELWV